MYRGK